MSGTMHELSREECLRLLAENGVGRLAVSGKDAGNPAGQLRIR